MIMKLIPALLLITAASTSAHGQAFTNLDFEAATVTQPPNGISFIDWSAAAPGWSHSAGADTSAVYYGGTHVGVTQWFLLTDAATVPAGPLAGAYSLSFASGYDSSNASGSQWVNAHVSQTGLLPSDARALTLLASGPLGITINGTAGALVSLGGSAYGVDVTAYAGQSAEIRFINTSTQLFNPVTIDNVAFSASPVPEPPVWLLLGMTLAGWQAVARRAKGCSSR
ncbi:hypothetical protein [Roseateles sp.]|uniref:hypothetical protein n=1 Tax=Roseateles sp. TaxID=1971397 RepID=UPI003BABA4A5